MTTRERKAFGGISEVAPAPNAAPCLVYATERNGADAVAPRPLRWEDWFQNAGAAQRSAMLALASRQGFLFAHQLPTPPHGDKNKPAPEDPAHIAKL